LRWSETFEMKKNITVKKIQKKENNSFVPGSAEERLGYVWPLTEEVCGLGGKYDAKQRLQRHVVRIVRGES